MVYLNLFLIKQNILNTLDMENIIFCNSLDIALRKQLDAVLALQKKCYNVNDLLVIKKLIEVIEETIANGEPIDTSVLRLNAAEQPEDSAQEDTESIKDKLLAIVNAISFVTVREETETTDEETTDEVNENSNEYVVKELTCEHIEGETVENVSNYVDETIKNEKILGDYSAFISRLVSAINSIDAEEFESDENKKFLDELVKLDDSLYKAIETLIQGKVEPEVKGNDDFMGDSINLLDEINIDDKNDQTLKDEYEDLNENHREIPVSMKTNSALVADYKAKLISVFVPTEAEKPIESNVTKGNSTYYINMGSVKVTEFSTDSENYEGSTTGNVKIMIQDIMPKFHRPLKAQDINVVAEGGTVVEKTPDYVIVHYDEISGENPYQVTITIDDASATVNVVVTEENPIPVEDFELSYNAQWNPIMPGEPVRININSILPENHRQLKADDVLIDGNVQILTNYYPDSSYFNVQSQIVGENTVTVTIDGITKSITFMSSDFVNITDFALTASNNSPMINDEITITVSEFAPENNTVVERLDADDFDIETSAIIVEQPHKETDENDNIVWIFTVKFTENDGERPVTVKIGELIKTITVDVIPSPVEDQYLYIATDFPTNENFVENSLTFTGQEDANERFRITPQSRNTYYIGIREDWQKPTYLENTANPVDKLLLSIYNENEEVIPDFTYENINYKVYGIIINTATYKISGWEEHPEKPVEIPNVTDFDLTSSEYSYSMAYPVILNISNIQPTNHRELTTDDIAVNISGDFTNDDITSLNKEATNDGFKISISFADLATEKHGLVTANVTIDGVNKPIEVQMTEPLLVSVNFHIDENSDPTTVSLIENSTFGEFVSQANINTDKPYYTFVGWRNNDEDYDVEANMPIDHDMNVYAEYTANMYFYCGFDETEFTDSTKLVQHEVYSLEQVNTDIVYINTIGEQIPLYIVIPREMTQLNDNNKIVLKNNYFINIPGEIPGSQYNYEAIEEFFIGDNVIFKTADMPLNAELSVSIGEITK